MLAIALISIIQVYSEDYFWVNGQGSWSDINSWRTSTGTIPNEVPDELDNVIFNENSFINNYDTVFILAANPTCKNMIFQNIQYTVVIVGGTGASTFSIYGSVTFHPKVINDYMGKIAFLSNESGNTITCAGTRFPGDIWFEGTGEWILQDTLFVYDSTDWKVIIYEGIEPLYQNPVIVHDNGIFDANEQVIITRGFVTASNNTRTCDIENSHILMVGNWILTGENLSFNAANSYILIGGNMSNTAGDVITYHDIDFLPVDGSIKNTDIKTIIRKVHFLGGGTVDGKKTPGQYGIFEIDTLLFDGAVTMAGPIPNNVKGINNKIHYTRLNDTDGHIDTDNSDYHRIDYTYKNFGFWPCDFKGKDNVIDSIFFFMPYPTSTFGGKNIVNNILYFKTQGAVGNNGYIGGDIENNINHLVFSADGYIGGNNTVELLTLNSGYWCQFQADSLIHPGSIYTGTYNQKVYEIEVIGGCLRGLTRLTSAHKQTMAYMTYLGGTLPTEYLMIQDIRNTGDEFIIDKGIDLGNNEGFNFTNPHGARDLYWVDGTGRWDTTNHWSLTSGGPPGECPPTILDNVYFDAASGFEAEATVYVKMKHASCNDMIWEDDVPNNPTLYGDTVNLHIWGSVKLSTSMTYNFFGKVYFESSHDTDYETIDLGYNLDGTKVYNLYNQTFFYGDSGRWELQSNLFNLGDSLFLLSGELKLDSDTINARNFMARDTLPKELYLLNNSLVVMRQYGAEAWLFNAWRTLEDPTTGVGPITIFDAGRSTIQMIGDYGKPPDPAPPGYCNFHAMGDSVRYFNIMFGEPELLFCPIVGIKSIMVSDNRNTFNLVDYYIQYGDAVNTGYIDTLTYKKYLNLDGDLVEAEGCKIRNNYFTNFLIAESKNDTVMGNQVIDTALFYQDGAMWGFNRVRYLKADYFMKLMFRNHFDEAYLYGNGHFTGSNVFDTLSLGPNKKYFFQHDLPGAEWDTTHIIKNFIFAGYCDSTIRIQSDSIGTQAHIEYHALTPTHPEFTAIFSSIRDINMVQVGNLEYIAAQSIDLGNNTNLIFTENAYDTVYWVGGTGEWGDYNHWSLVSGDTSQMYNPSNCTPNEVTTVIFDENSFVNPTDIVTITVLNAYCKDMIWENTPGFQPTFISGDSISLYIYGSLELSAYMNYLFEGTIYFDEIEEPGYIPDHILSRGQTYYNDIHFQGINDVLVLEDDMTLITGETPSGIVKLATVVLEHGSLVINGQHLRTGSFSSPFKNTRMLNMENSTITVNFPPLGIGDLTLPCWHIDATDLQFYADNSTIINETQGGGAMLTENGDYVKYHNIILNGVIDSLFNRFNTTEYNVIQINGPSSLVLGNYVCDTVFFRSTSSGIFDKSITNVVIYDSSNCIISGVHKINRVFVYQIGTILSKGGNNRIEYCEFHDDGTFRGENVFDTLVLFPGSIYSKQKEEGNWFYFEGGKTQFVIDSLYIRGNQCSNITLKSTTAPGLAYIEKLKGPAIIESDFLYINSVAAVAGEDSIFFYAGTNSSPVPDPNNEPPGWIFDNSQGYVYGFGGRTERFCQGGEYNINAGDFNGDPYTLYYWEGSPMPGDINYTVTKPGTYHIAVQYFDGCIVEDYIVIEEDYPPLATVDPGPYCEGDPIVVEVIPGNSVYKYAWSTGETNDTIFADLDYNGEIYVEVTDTTNNCKANIEQVVEIRPMPVPEVSLGPDAEIKFQEYITLDAGEGTTYAWSNEQNVPIPDPAARSLTVTGYGDVDLNPVDYMVIVDLNGCIDTGYKQVYMFPPSRLGVPTAFSPNGDTHNDVLEIKGSGFEKVVFRIYNRYGKLVFETTNPDMSETWDGTVNGQPQEMEVYTYYISVLYQDGGTAEEKGNITLIR